MKEFIQYGNGVDKPQDLSQAQLETTNTLSTSVDLEELRNSIKMITQILPQAIEIRIFEREGYWLITRCFSREEILATFSEVGVA